MKRADFKIVKDFIWYSMGFAVPALINFIKTPVFARYFTTEEYGYVGIVTATFSYGSAFIYGLTGACLWRYNNNYKNENKLNMLYSNVFFIYILFSSLLFFLSGIWLFFTKSQVLGRLIILNYIQIIIYQVLELCFIIIRLQGRSRKYNILTIFISLLCFAILLILTFGFNKRIESVTISSISANLVAFLYLVFIYRKRLKSLIHLKWINKKVLKKLTNYGFSSIIANIGILILASSDRYIIALYNSMDSVGIYNQIYTISQYSISALSGVYFNAINPLLYDRLERDYTGYTKTANRFTSIYIFILLPFTLYFSIFSKQVCDFLLGNNFKEGYVMVPFIMFSMFFYGLLQFNQDILRFGDKMNILRKGILLSGIFNILMNFAAIPVFGYKAASVTTLIAYVFLYVFYYFHDSLRYFSRVENIKVISIPVGVLMTQVMTDFLLRKIFLFEINTVLTILEGMFYLLVYTSLMFYMLRKSWVFSGIF